MLSSFSRTACLIATLAFSLTVSASASDGLRLSTVASDDGYTYEWMPTEAGASLSRPGVRIVLRAGRLFYEVNNATPIADRAPRFDGRDLVISPKLAAHLREIARAYPYPSEEAGVREVGFRPESKAFTGALTINARQIPGREALALRGTGPANVPVTITLTGELSLDLPIVVLAVKTVTSAADGSYSADIDYGQDTHANTTLAATASSVLGVTPAVARFVIGVPSAQVKSSGLDVWPKK